MEWINPSESVQIFEYDRSNPPTSPLIADFIYFGPSFRKCGRPAIFINDSEGLRINFLSATFNSVGNNIEISLFNRTTARRGTYTLNA